MQKVNEIFLRFKAAKLNKELLSSIIFFLLILPVGLIARLQHIAQTSFWYDEAFTGLLIREEPAEFIRILVQDRVHPPIYYVLLKLARFILGDSDLVTRGFSLVFGLALIIAAFVLLKKLFGNKIALLTSFIFSISPFFILYSIEARSYSMLTFEALLAIYVFIKLYKKNLMTIKGLITDKHFLLLIIIALILLLTHYLSVFLITSLFALLIFKRWPVFGKITVVCISIALVILLAKGIFTGSYGFIASDVIHTKWLSAPIPQDFGEMLYTFILGVNTQGYGDQQSFNLSFILNYNLIFLFIVGVIFAKGIRDSLYAKNENLKIISRVFVFSCLMVLTVSLFGINFFLPRYLTVLAVLFVVWLGASIGSFKLRPLGAFLIIYIFLLTQVQWVNYIKDYGAIADMVIKEDRRVVFTSTFDFLSMKYYMNNRKEIYFLDTAEINMKSGLWPYFDQDEILLEVGNEDVVYRD